jgi:hypothetical protein
MSWLWAVLSSTGVLDSAICPSIVAELLGYRLFHLFYRHTLLFPSHTPAIRSRSRIVHRFLLYPERESMSSRSSKTDPSQAGPLRGETAGLAIGLSGYRLRTPLDSQASEDARGTEVFQ